MRDSFSLRDLTFAYPAASSPVLENVSVDLPRGAVIAVLGPSGAGKSTLMYLLGLLGGAGSKSCGIRYFSGDGTPVDYASLTESAEAGLRKREFGFVFQSAFLIPHLTCTENVELPLVLAGWDEGVRREHARALLSRVGLEQKAERIASDISGGERQRVALLRAVAHDPQLVFADEPFGALDPRNAGGTLRLLCREWQSGALCGESTRKERTVIMVCHDLLQAARFATHFLILRSDHRTNGVTIRSRSELDSSPEECSRRLAMLCGFIEDAQTSASGGN